MRFVGGKNGSGVYQAIINNIPLIGKWIYCRRLKKSRCVDVQMKLFDNYL